jgi:hypothetical protein
MMPTPSLFAEPSKPIATTMMYRNVLKAEEEGEKKSCVRNQKKTLTMIRNFQTPP